ncbi:MAG: hypothetical protein AB8F78_15715 [Saprospiraceae bacterium]
MPFTFIRTVVILSLVLLGTSSGVLAQAESNTARVDSALIERTIVEAKWRYVYTMHVGSSTIIHEAGDEYDFYLYFRYDYTAEEFLNGRYERKAWALAGDQIFYPFRNVNVFRVTQAGRQNLALEFTQPNSKGAYQYHFVRVDDIDAPFIKPVNQLPTVLVEGITKQKRKRRRLKGDEIAGVKKNRRWWPFKKRKKEEKAPNVKREKREKEKEERRISKEGVAAVDMMIEITGGGFFGGIDPVMRDYAVIKPGGRLVKEFKSVQTELRRTAADLNVEEYNRLAEYIESKGFFDLDRVYDCSSEACVNRKRLKPTPIPLRIAVSNGRRKKVVNIAIWGQDNRGIRYVDYPQELEDVIQAVLKVSNGAEYSFAKK